MNKRTYLFLPLLFGIILFTLGCGSGRAAELEAGNEAPDRPTVAVAALVPTQTNVQTVSTDTSAPQATLPPPATPTPIPVLDTPAATPTPEPVALLTLEDFGSDRNPLTGEKLEDAAVLERMPIGCKISNSPAKYTRPQAGLNAADLVFEHYNLWSSTRFTAFFYGQTPPDVGPVRSARLIDVELPAMYHAALCFSGANVGVSRRLFNSDISQRILRSNVDGYYTTEEDKPQEHRLHADLNGLWQELETRGFGGRPEFGQATPFDTTPPQGGEPATKIEIELIEETAEWQYQAENGRYWRWTKGEVHRDANTGDQLNFRNVVALFVPHMEDRAICAVPHEDGSCQFHSIEIQLWGRGRAVVFRDGRVYVGEWRREGRGDMLTFYTEAGEAIPLQIGNTFFQVVPAYAKDQLTYTP